MARVTTKEDIQWRKAVIKRDKCCVICKTMENLTAHHIDCYSYHPEKRFLLENGVTACEFHHTLYHTSYNYSYREKTDRKDWNNFLEMLKKLNIIT